MSKPENSQQFPAICWPVPKNNRGGEFSNLEEMLAHLEGEATGHWLIGRNGMWHGGIHITDTSTPWCALSGQSMNEAVDFPVPFKGEQPVRCMADGEVVAYRINRDYLSMPWYWGDLHYSGSFVLIRHRIQPGETAESGLTFYTLYMHLAPWLAYTEQDSTAFKVADGQHLNAYADASRQSVAAELPPGTRVIWDKAVSADTMTGSNGRQYAHVTLAEPVTGRMSLKAGDRVWTVCNKGNLVPARDSVTRPAWWLPFLPPSRETVQFDTVVCPTPYPIKAGDPVGHLGYFQVPTDNGHEKRYQVHIECLTTDDLPRFLSNPEGVGRDTPAFARCPKDIPVYLKVADGEIHKGLITTESETVMALSGQAVTDKEGKRYWPGGGVSRGLVAESDVQLLSRYDLAGRGFKATEDDPESFDHLDGKRQPKGLVRKIFELF
ncbi:TPA: M23 family metallopeptidase, partial [Escherichia coli]|nr:M23 family metallopeptidase [Escherichia coli]HAP0270519.1 M23 family metallopeptidase [Escherichia coli]HAP0338470.1 M23 family metallopeptidase [Escherichia coli]